MVVEVRIRKREMRGYGGNDLAQLALREVLRGRYESRPGV
jgi:hypothetical protein